MKRIFQFLPQESIKIYAIISLSVGLISFLAIALSSESLILNLVFSLGLTTFIFISCILGEFLGEKRHSKIIKSKAFKALITKGFKIDIKNNYHGLTGSYNGYIFDVYYDWSTFVRSKVYKAVIFNIYFLPPKNSNDTTDHNRLNIISEKHKISKWSFKKYIFLWRDGNLIMRNGVGVFNPSPKKLFGRMDLAIKILKSESLKPVDRKTLDELRQKDPMNNIPEIEVYFDESKNNL